MTRRRRRRWRRKRRSDCCFISMVLLVGDGISDWSDWKSIIITHCWTKFIDLSYSSTRLFLPDDFYSLSPSPRSTLILFFSLLWCLSTACSILLPVLSVCRVQYLSSNCFAVACGCTASSMVLQNCTLWWWSCRICFIFRVSWCLLKASSDFRRLFTRWWLAISTLWRKLRRACYSWPRRALP